MRTVHRSIARSLATAAAIAAAFSLQPAAASAQVTVGGVGYVQYGFALAKDTLTADSSIQHVNNFDITRAYINVGARLPGGIVTRVTADIFQNAAINGSRLFRLKYAYVAWTPDSSHLTYKIGQMHTPYIDWEEALWDYRMQGTMPMERNGYMSSSDFGLGVDGKWNTDAFNFQAGIYNGENYNGGLSDQRKDFMARASYRIAGTNDMTRVGGLRVTGYAQLGMPGSGGTRNRFIGSVSYKTTDLTLAAEYAATKDTITGGNTTVGGGAVGPLTSRSGQVVSAFGVFHIPASRVSFIGRVDLVDPNTASTAANDKQTRIIAGVSYQLTPNVRLLVDYDGVSYESGFAPGTASAPNPNTSYASYAARQQLYFHTQFTF
jgi:hypothetical protein